MRPEINALTKLAETGQAVCKAVVSAEKAAPKVVEEVAQGPQKVFAENVMAMCTQAGRAVGGKYLNKKFLDTEAQKAFETFCAGLRSKPQEEALSAVLKELENPNSGFVEVLSLDIRNFSKKFEELKQIVGDKAFEEKVKPSFSKAYAAFTDKLWADKSVSLEEMLTIRPDWSFREILKKVDFNKPFNIGKLPKDFVSEPEFDILCNHLTKVSKQAKEVIPKTFDLNINGKTLTVKRFSDGQTTQGVFSVTKDGKTYVVKMHSNGTYSDEMFEGSSKITSCPNRAIFTDVYLTNNNCRNSAKMYYCNYAPQTGKTFTVSELVQADKQAPVMKVTDKDFKMPDMEALSVRFKDTTGVNNVLWRNGEPVCVDNKYSDVVLPFELFSWGRIYPRMSMF